MIRYSQEFKESAIRKILPPENRSISELSEETGVTKTTLRKWKKEAQVVGAAAPCNEAQISRWNGEDRLQIVLETYGLNESERSEYCRSKGLYPEDIKAWRNACIKAAVGQAIGYDKSQQEAGVSKKKYQELEKELRRKEKALAEAAALLVFRKKAQAIWGDEEEE
ncbi:transposase [Dethiosulfovibrio salsuginis]|uniref:Transposase n=1 Tax=Dethiosulfovibrio salsuginis TaxID=561720 RepID=A0A1X7LEU1_9BACT|nr:transposase [Dethiosulfovibrio salsuginis]SMG43871.1 Transposase [Dethiosulfovibrio salsuginis]SMG51728.1 Transposase [Dethiosulfovibrio salsuginis]SMG52358.1 Transposase [Dethiosulfovibrio salsuginis]